MPQTMKAMSIRSFGAPSVFEPAEMPVPEIDPGEVLIAVAGSSVNPVDWKIRKGLAATLCPAFPAVLHPDCAGIVAKVGADVTHLKEGDHVYAFASGLVGKQGALAEYMAADARMVARAPAAIPITDAATLPLVCVTAWMALLRPARIAPGASILIQGGVGGVGSIAIQIARAKFGARVFATCGSPEKCAIAESIGALKAYNYRSDSPASIVQDATDGRGFDVVFNTPGGASINDAVAFAAFGGAILDINGALPTEAGLNFKCLTLHSLFAGYPITHGFDQARVGEILAAVAELVAAGALRPLVDANRFSFADVGAAHALLEGGGATGKVALHNPWSTPVSPELKP